jgi:hypothetical protein
MSVFLTWAPTIYGISLTIYTTMMLLVVRSRDLFSTQLTHHFNFFIWSIEQPCQAKGLYNPSNLALKAYSFWLGKTDFYMLKQRWKTEPVLPALRYQLFSLLESNLKSTWSHVLVLVDFGKHPRLYDFWRTNSVPRQHALLSPRGSGFSG